VGVTHAYNGNAPPVESPSMKKYFGSRWNIMQLAPYHGWKVSISIFLKRLHVLRFGQILLKTIFLGFYVSELGMHWGCLWLLYLTPNLDSRKTLSMCLKIGSLVLWNTRWNDHLWRFIFIDTILFVFDSSELDFLGGYPSWYYSCRNTVNCGVLIGL